MRRGLIFRGNMVPQQTETGNVPRNFQSCGHCKGTNFMCPYEGGEKSPLSLARSPQRAPECVHRRISSKYLTVVLVKQQLCCSSQPSSPFSPAQEFKVAFVGRKADKKMKETSTMPPTPHHIWALQETQCWKEILSLF